MPRKNDNRYIEEVFDQLTTEDHLELRRARGLQYRAKLIRSGNMLELELYPENPSWKALAGQKREKLGNPSREVQVKLNHKNRQKKFMRKIHANFSDGDIYGTLDYLTQFTPANHAEAMKFFRNFIKRLQRYIKKHNLPALKWMQTTEWVLREDTGEFHAHHHIITNFRDREALEKIWGVGFRPQTRALQADENGYAALANYFTKPETKQKHRKGEKTYSHSKNLVKPKENFATGRIPTTNQKISKRRVAEMAKDHNKTIEILEENFTGYKITAPPTVLYSDYSPGAYIYARLIKTPERGDVKCRPRQPRKKR